MVVRVVSLAKNSNIKTGKIMERVWPRFMTPDSYIMEYWRRMRTEFSEYQLCLIHEDTALGVGSSLPIHWSGDTEKLPKNWSDTFIKGIEFQKESEVNTLAAVNIAIHPEYQKLGLSRRLLSELKELAECKGFKYMISTSATKL
jgi:ribosomal protein S18 acetylase RimI-like enzyme